MDTKPLVVVFGGMSGAGKTTIVNAVLACDSSRFGRVITATTRPKRIGEVDGVDYHFFTLEEFDKRLAAGEFLETATVYGHRYGTLRESVCGVLHAGRIPLINVDIQGLMSIKRNAGSWSILSIFITPKSMSALSRRLYARAAKDGTSRASVKQRLLEARAGAGQIMAYDCFVTNDWLKMATRKAIEHIDTRLKSLTLAP